MEQFAKRAYVVHVDVDPKEIGKIKAVNLSVNADVGDVLRVLSELVAEVRYFYFTWPAYESKTHCLWC